MKLVGTLILEVEIEPTESEEALEAIRGAVTTAAAKTEGVASANIVEENIEEDDEE